MLEHNDAPWMCFMCGYFMDSVTVASGKPVAPEDGDTSICLNCGALYQRGGTRWLPLTPAKLDKLDPRHRAELLHLSELRRKVIGDNALPKKGGGRA